MTTFAGKVSGSALVPESSGWSHLYVYEPSAESPSYTRGSLYILFDLRKIYEALGSSIIDAVRESYYQNVDLDPLQSFEEALGRANQAIEDFDKKMITTRQESLQKINIVCAILVGQDLHIAQIGNADIYLVRGGRLNKINNTGPSAADQVQSFLNIASGKIEVGDIFTLSTARTFEVIPLSQFKEIVATCYPSVAASRFAEIIRKAGAGAKHVPSILIVEMNAESIVTPSPVNADDAETEMRKATPTGTLPSARDQELDNRIIESKDGIAAKLAGESVYAEDAEATHLTDYLQEGDFSEYAPQARRTSANRLRQLSGILGRGLELFVGALLAAGSFVTSILSGKTDRRGLRNIFLVLAILLAVAALYNVARSRNQVNPNVQSTTSYDSAVTNYDQALNAMRQNALTNAREFLLAARIQAKQAVELGVNQQESNALLADIEKELDRLDGVTRLDELNVVADIAELNPAGKPVAMAATEAALFLLDEAAQQVYALTINSEQLSLSLEAILPGSQVTEIASTDSTLYLHSAGSTAESNQMLVYDPSADNLDKVKTAFTEPVKPSSALTSWADATGDYRLYTIDPTSAALWRYRFQGEQLAAPQDVINAGTERPDFPAVIDLAIDGQVFLLTAGGQVLRYEGGELDTTFRLTGLKVPLKDPIALTTGTATAASPQGAGSTLYIADRGNNRIITVDKTTGQLLKIFAANHAFTDLRDLYIEPNNNLLYVLDGSKVYKIQQ